jgi:membrane dipeptidase
MASPRVAPGVSRHALDLVGGCEVVDLHVESFVWTRVAGYDLSARHRLGPLGGRLWSQADIPRLLAGGVTGAVLSIATNPFRRAPGRAAALAANLARLRAALEADGRVAVVADAAGFRRGRAAGRLACWLALQGGNAVGPAEVRSLPAEVSRVTLVHLTRSALGTPASPLPVPRDGGLTTAGRDYVAALCERRILVDLAHAGRRTFWDALAVHPGTQPPVVSHTGVCGVHDCWRNVDDDQIRAVADRGGLVGVMFHSGFLGEPTAAAVVRHLAHVVRVGGEGAAALGSDWDGFIVPPRDLRSADRLPVLVQAMLDAGFPDQRVAAVLGGNALRVMEAVRPG